MHLVSERRDPRRLAAVFATITLAFVALLLFAGRAGAVENVYWNNYDGGPAADTVSFADITGSGGGILNLGAAKLDGPEGMAYDTVTNRLFVAGSSSGAKGEILAINLDGSGAAPFIAPGAPVDSPEGVAVDPASRTIFWANTGGATSIVWAKLDGSAGGVLDITGATLSGPCCRVAIDPVGGRVYWVNTGTTPNTISYANTNNTGGGGTLNLTGSTLEPGGEGIAIDSATGRLYFTAGDKIGFANLNGSGGGDLDTTGAIIDEPYGLAIDPSLGRLYTGNYGNGEVRTGAIGIVNFAGPGGGISPLTAPVDGPQDPVIIKSPAAAGAPAITRNPKKRSELTCSTGSWGADFVGGFVYQAPRSFAYQWTRNGLAVPGATAATLATTQAGSYACAVTATNQAGATAQASGAVNVKASKVKLSTKRKAKADPGDLVTFTVKIVNQGDVQSKAARICVKLPNAAKDDLRKPKCKKVAKLNGLAKRTTKFRIKVKPGADEGTDKLTFQVKGTPGKAAKSKIIVR